MGGFRAFLNINLALLFLEVVLNVQIRNSSIFGDGFSFYHVEFFDSVEFLFVFVVFFEQNIDYGARKVILLPKFEVDVVSYLLHFIKKVEDFNN